MNAKSLILRIFCAYYMSKDAIKIVSLLTPNYTCYEINTYI